MSEPAPSRFCPLCELRTDAALCPTDQVPTVRGDFDHGDVRDEAIGRVVAGRFQIEQFLGQGGSGRVYLATQLSVSRPVALKLLQPHHAKDRVHVRRFYREARAATRLEGEHVVRVHDFGVDDDTRTPFIAMEHLRGETLREVIARGPMPPAVAAGLAAQVARALIEAEHAGIVHRDLKPANIMCVAGRDGPHLKVMDFGVAKDLVGGDTDTLTAQGVALGTPAYMAPEQVSGGDVGARADLYALGCLLYEMVTGQPPFVSEARAELYLDHLLKPAPTLPAKVGAHAVPPALVALVRELLAKAPAERPGSAVEVVTRLDAIARGDVADVRRGHRRRMLLALALGAAALTTIGVIAISASQSSQTVATDGASEAIAVEAYEHLVVRGAAATIRLRVGHGRPEVVEGDAARVSQEIESERLTLAIAAPDTSGETLTIDVFAPTWKTIKVSGLATVEGALVAPPDGLSLALSGSARARIEVTGPSLVTSLRGSSEVFLSGAVVHHEIRAGGASRLEAAKLVSEETTLSASGSSDITVNARVRLDARNEGTGEIVYYGSPPELTTSGDDIHAGEP